MKAKWKITHWPDEMTPMSIEDEQVRVDWYDCGEGLCGDYNPDDPDDVHLLRFDVYVKENGSWAELEDASYCTNMPYETDPVTLMLGLIILWKEYKRAVESGGSVKKLGEMMSYISPEYLHRSSLQWDRD